MPSPVCDAVDAISPGEGLSRFLPEPKHFTAPLFPGVKTASIRYAIGAGIIESSIQLTIV